jgi:hypothetical protein
MLHFAARGGQQRGDAVVTREGAEGRCGHVELHWAANYGHEVAVRLLLERGAGVASKDRYGNTALHLVADPHKAVVL